METCGQYDLISANNPMSYSSLLPFISDILFLASGTSLVAAGNASPVLFSLAPAFMQREALEYTIHPFSPLLLGPPSTFRSSPEFTPGRLPVVQNLSEMGSSLLCLLAFCSREEPDNLAQFDLQTMTLKQKLVLPKSSWEHGRMTFPYDFAPDHSQVLLATEETLLSLDLRDPSRSQPLASISSWTPNPRSLSYLEKYGPHGTFQVLLQGSGASIWDIRNLLKPLHSFNPWDASLPGAGFFSSQFLAYDPNTRMGITSPNKKMASPALWFWDWHAPEKSPHNLGDFKHPKRQDFFFLSFFFSFLFFLVLQKSLNQSSQKTGTNWNQTISLISGCSSTMKFSGGRLCFLGYEEGVTVWQTSPCEPPKYLFDIPLAGSLWPFVDASLDNSLLATGDGKVNINPLFLKKKEKN